MVCDDRPVARVVVIATQGSVPREVGASMVVGVDGLLDGTIGGGALEHEAISVAQDALAEESERVDRRPLGPQLGQCCGGSVTLLTEIWSVERLGMIANDVVARPLPGSSAEPALPVTRALARMRDGRDALGSVLVANWLIEPVMHPSRDVWIWGAGHVGRAIISVLEPLPGLNLFWADSDENRFPVTVHGAAELMIAANPADLVPLSSAHAEHYVLTYSHALDLEICHRVLNKPFGFLGLIGSETKRARFQSRLRALGHSDAQIDRLHCPIGDRALGKHPQEIALGVATEILQRQKTGVNMLGQRA